VTPLVVVILAAMWVLVLVPPLLRSRSEGRPSTSIGSFRRQLATLSRTQPDPRSAMRSLNRAVVPMHPPPAGRRPVSGYAHGPPPARARTAYEQPVYESEYDDHSPAYRRPAARPMQPRSTASLGYGGRTTRADVRRRRTNVLFGLLALAAATAVGGFGLGVSALIAVHVLVDAVLVFYVYLLVQLRRAEEERAMRYAWSKAA
jgi:hypothetical protein